MSRSVRLRGKLVDKEDEGGQRERERERLHFTVLSLKRQVVLVNLWVVGEQY